MAGYFNPVEAPRFQTADRGLLDLAAGGGVLGTVGAGITSLRNSALKQAELDSKLAADRRAEAANKRAEAEYQMKVDAVAQAAKEKEAANRYADALGAATSGNVVGMPDQKILGEQVAAMGEKARAAYASGNKGLGDEIAAQQESYINSVLPKMTKAYEASPEAQLQVLRGTNPLKGTADLAPQTRLALLKEAEAPIEKKADRIQALADQKALLAEQAKMQEAADIRREARDDKKWKAMQDIAEAKENRVLEKTTKAQQQKLTDKALAEVTSFSASLKALKDSDPSNTDIPMLEKELATTVHLIDKGVPTTEKNADGSVKYVPAPIESLTNAVESLKERNKVLGTYKHEKMKETDKEYKEILKKAQETTNRRLFTDDLDMDDVIGVATDGLSDTDRSALVSRYGDNETGLVQLLADIKERAPEVLPLISGAVNTPNLDTNNFLWLGQPSVESKLKSILKNPDLIDKITGVKLNRNNVLAAPGGSYSLGTD